MATSFGCNIFKRGDNIYIFISKITFLLSSRTENADHKTYIWHPAWKQSKREISPLIYEPEPQRCIASLCVIRVGTIRILELKRRERKKSIRIQLIYVREASWHKMTLYSSNEHEHNNSPWLGQCICMVFRFSNSLRLRDKEMSCTCQIEIIDSVSLSSTSLKSRQKLSLYVYFRDDELELYLNFAGEKTPTQSSLEGSGCSRVTVTRWTSSPCHERNRIMHVLD